MENKIVKMLGRGVPVYGPDIDTDRIIPARYLRTVTFENLGEHAFADDRIGGGHPFDDPRFAGASVLIVNANFGCGSSREHAPQALHRWGIKAFVGESFAEIFFGNCVAMGLPCLVAGAAEVTGLQEVVEAAPAQELIVDLAAQTVTCGDRTIPATLPKGTRAQFLTGNWDSLGQLLDAGAEIAAVAGRLPYIADFTRC